MVSAGELARRELNSQFIHSQHALTIAVVAACISLIISFVHLYRHLKQYTMPQIQMWIIRILLICPAYAICSSLAVGLGSPNGMYVEFVRDLYEAFVVYSLLNLIMEYCGGEQDCVYAIENEAPLEMPFPCCCMRPKARDAMLLRFCQRGVLQFVFIKPVMATTDVIMMATGNYYNPVFVTIETIIYNFSYAIALYSLLVMYLATKTQLSRFRCITKISAVKSVIVISYYQSLLIKLAPCSEEEQFMWKSFMLTLEMVVFASILACAFPISEFLAGIPNRRVLSNMKDLFAVRDLVEGFEHNFNSEYKDYALQRQVAESGLTDSDRLNKYFGNMLDPTALEMTERYRGRSSRLQFNSLLRGDRPIRAGLRRDPRDTNSLLGGHFKDLESGDADSELGDYYGDDDEDGEVEVVLNPISDHGSPPSPRSASSPSSSYTTKPREPNTDDLMLVPPSSSSATHLPAIEPIAPPRAPSSRAQDTPLSKIAARDELKCSGGATTENNDQNGDEDDIEGGTQFQSFHGASRNVIQDDILFAANAFTAKGAEDYLDSSSHQSPSRIQRQGVGGAKKAGGRGGAEDQEEEDEELAQPILLK